MGNHVWRLLVRGSFSRFIPRSMLLSHATAATAITDGKNLVHTKLGLDLLCFVFMFSTQQASTMVLLTKNRFVSHSVNSCAFWILVRGVCSIDRC